jgi:hypothetical protein
MFDIFLDNMKSPAILLSSQEVLVIMIVTAIVVFVVSRGRRGGK